MRLAANRVMVNPGMERLGHLSGGAIEGDPVPAVCGIGDQKTLGSQPIGELVDIGVAETEAVGILGGSQPVMVGRRSGILLVLQQLGKLSLLMARRLQEQDDGVYGVGR